MLTPFRSFIIVGGIAGLGVLVGGKIGQVAMAQGADPYQEIDTLAQAIHHIEAQYIEPVSTGELIFGAIQGMADTLDPHTVFLEPDELSAAQVRTEGVYSGIGIELKTVSGNITVFRVVPDSPSDGHIEPGEQLIAVDGQPVGSLSQAGEALRGQDGAPVVVTLLSEGNRRDLTLIRARIRDKTVRLTTMDHGWALAEISRFQRNTASDLERSLRKLKPSRGVIIDLRGNGGGLLEEAVDVVDMFTKNGLIVRTRGRDDTTLEEHYAQPSAPWHHLKTIVLVDGESASASEIVAGALRSLHGAQLVGSPTYGKWSVQRLYVFESKSAIKLTVAKYEIANADVQPDTEGLKPDIRVDRFGPKKQAEMALRERLKGDQKALALVETLALTSDKDVVEPVFGPLKKRLHLDPQLKAAWTLALDNL